MESEAPAAALGPFRVRVDEEREAAFRREIGFPSSGGDAAPASFPAVWLSSPEIHAALSREYAKMDAVPVHESQSFSYVAPLRVGESYDLSVVLRREAAPPRIVLEATVATAAGDVCARIETMLRIAPRAGLRRDPAA